MSRFQWHASFQDDIDCTRSLGASILFLLCTQMENDLVLEIIVFAIKSLILNRD